jgi:hypothetical protein
MSSSTSSFRRFVGVFCTVFVAGACAFVVGSELLIRLVVAPHDDYDQYKVLFRIAHAPVAAFGDSHVANAIESNEEIVNLGYAGETLWLMLFKARTYVESSRGERIVLQFSPEQFAIYRAEKDQTAVADDLLGRRVLWLKFMEPHFRGYLLAYWNSFLRDPGVLFTARAEPAPKAKTDVSAKVGAFALLSSDEQRRVAEIRVQLHAPLPQGPATEALIAQFASALRGFNKLGVKTCIVEYPLTGAYREAAARAPTFAAMRGRIAQLAWAEHARYLDLTKAMPDVDFSDSDHVAPFGRGLATRLVLDGCFGAKAGASTR